MESIIEIWAYRQMIVRFVRKELRTRYKASVLGFLWTFLNPLLQLLVYTFVFSVIMQNPVQNYSMFLFVALVPFIFLTSSLQSGTMCVISSKNIVEKICFPRIVLPIATTCSSLMNMLYTMIIVFASLIITGIGIGPTVLFLPVIMLIEFVFVLGLTFIVASLNVYFRDVEQIVNIITLLWQFLTPVMYGDDIIKSPIIKQIFNINPMTSIINIYRSILYYKTIPDFSTIGTTLIFAFASLIIGYFLFQKLQRGFAEEL
jgi:lipopolysaccharide transport system permease protein